MRSSLVVCRPRTGRLAFGEKRPESYHKKKRAKQDVWRQGRTTYVPGKHSPLYKMVEEVRALPLEWWEQKHKEDKMIVLTSEEMAESAAKEKERDRLAAEKRAKVLAEREAVKKRTVMLQDLFRATQPKVDAFLKEKEAAAAAKAAARHA